MHAFEWKNVRLAAPPRSARGAEARRRLVLAASELMAERGIDAVSPAEVVALAGQHNVSAVSYHFGSREALLIALVMPREDVRRPIDAERTRLLDAVLADGRPPTLDDLVLIMVRPVVVALADRDTRNFVRVVVQLLRLLPLEDRAKPYMPWEPRLMPLVLESLPHASEAIRLERLGTCFTLLNELLANRARDIEHGVTPNLDDEAFVADVASMMVGLLTAPSGVSEPG